jgi:1-carboxybiuret hydrolase
MSGGLPGIASMSRPRSWPCTVEARSPAVYGDFDPMTRDCFLAGALVPANWVIEAQRFRRWYREQLLALFNDTDILLMPPTRCSAPSIGQDMIEIEGVSVPSRPYLGVYTQPLSFIGAPIVVVPPRVPGELPIGVQIVAAPWHESDALRMARTLEQDGVTCELPPRVIGY